MAQRPGWSKPEIESAAEDRRIHSQVPVLVEVVRGVESFWVRGGARGANILGEGKLQGLVLFPLKPRQDLSWEKGRGDGRAKGCRLVCNTGAGPSAPLRVWGGGRGRLRRTSCIPGLPASIARSILSVRFLQLLLVKACQPAGLQALGQEAAGPGKPVWGYRRTCNHLCTSFLPAPCPHLSSCSSAPPQPAAPPALRLPGHRDLGGGVLPVRWVTLAEGLIAQHCLAVGMWSWACSSWFLLLFS